MRTDPRMACAVLATLALAGCFAEAEDKSVVFQQALPVCSDGTTSCTFKAVPPSLEQFIPIDIGASAEFTIDLGDQEFLEPQKSLGPATLTDTLTLNSATLQATTPGVDFSGIQELRLREITSGASCSGGDTCAAPSCQDIATYDQSRDGAATDTITLRGTSINMLELMSSGKLTLCVVAKGVPPSTSWRADTILDMGLKAHAGM